MMSLFITYMVELKTTTPKGGLQEPLEEMELQTLIGMLFLEEMGTNQQLSRVIQILYMPSLNKGILIGLI